jgi:hypothetical protein
MQYNKQTAIDILSAEYGWKAYPQKHFESRFTRFYESYWLPKRFGYDTRRVQFSSLIVTDQMSRDEALDMMLNPSCTSDYERSEFKYVANKLAITTEELESYLTMPKKWYFDYNNEKRFFDLGAKVLNFIYKDKAIIKR